MTAGRDLATLPKAHLHLHLEGAMRPSTLAQLAATHDMVVPPIRGFADFGAFVGMYRAACAVLSSEVELRRLVREVVEDAAADGAVWIEPAFYPPNHLDRLGPNEATTEIVLDELALAGAALGVGTGLVIAADRTVAPPEALALARLAAHYAAAGQAIVGFGLANDEAGHPPEPFAEAFEVARDAGLLAVPHGGELEGPDSVRGCLDACGAHRVMHGVRAVEDPALMARLADERICLDVCPSSNVALGVVASIDRHPLPRLLDAGIPCSINADDPLLFGPGILAEYRLCRDQLLLDDDTLAHVAACSIEASGAPEADKRTARAALDAWLSPRDQEAACN